MQKLLVARRLMDNSYPIPFPIPEDEPEDEEEFMEGFVMADNFKVREEFIWHPKRKF